MSNEYSKSDHDDETCHYCEELGEPVPGVRLLPLEDLEEDDVEEGPSRHALEDDGGEGQRRRVQGALAGDDEADADPEGRHEGESGYVHYDQGGLGPRGDQLDPDTEGDDQLVRGDGGAEVPHVSRVLLQTHGQPLEHRVEGQGHHGQQAPERLDHRHRLRRRGSRLGGLRHHRLQPRGLLVVVPDEDLSGGGDGRGRRSVLRLVQVYPGDHVAVAAPHAQGPVEHLFVFLMVRLVQESVDHFLYQVDEEESDTEDELREVDAGLYNGLGDDAGLEDRAHGLPDLGLEVHEGGVEEDAAAEAEEERDDEGLAPGRAARGVLPAQAGGQLDGQDPEHEGGQPQDGHRGQLGHDEPVAPLPAVRLILELCELHG